MERECFEDKQVADALQADFISIKVDKEERPDIDSIYMSVCQAFTGSGGWPMTILMTPEQKPFFAGTYLPKHTQRGMMGLLELLSIVKDKWAFEKETLIASGTQIVDMLASKEQLGSEDVSQSIVQDTYKGLQRTFDAVYGGFGSAPKFPTPHQLLFLLGLYEQTKDSKALEMVEKTLVQMYKGGLFDHIGFGFSRYSTDRLWLAPHFEKMLYDNALLILAYLEAFDITHKPLYQSVAQKTMEYVLRELRESSGGFFCAQDADSEGEEGKYYLFSPDEILTLLDHEDGMQFCHHFDITQQGNFEGLNIPNLLKNEDWQNHIEELLPKVRVYRATRMALHKDDKMLTSWNALIIAAFAKAYYVFGDAKYLDIANAGLDFINEHLSDEVQLFVSFREGHRSGAAFLDDYAYMIYALLQMYHATLDGCYLQQAIKWNQKVVTDFFDHENGGFFLYGNTAEELITRPKEIYDGAMPSGNSVMAHNLLQLASLTKEDQMQELAEKQVRFLSAGAKDYPSGHTFFALSLLRYFDPPQEIICVLKDAGELAGIVFPKGSMVRLLYEQTEEYRLKNDRMTFYVCKGRQCLPPTNTL